MPERQRIKRYPSEEVQGADSYVKCMMLTIAEDREARKLIKDGGDLEVVSTTILVGHIVEWNWVDDDGEPMPLPKDDVTIIDQLTGDEARFLGQCIQGISETEIKN